MDVGVKGATANPPSLEDSRKEPKTIQIKTERIPRVPEKARAQGKTVLRSEGPPSRVGVSSELHNTKVKATDCALVGGRSVATL